MDSDEAIRITQDRLRQEGGSVADLLEIFRAYVSKNLIDDTQWQAILKAAQQHPIELGALPFGFEFPLHDERPVADFGITLLSQRNFFPHRFVNEPRRQMPDAHQAIESIFDQLEDTNSRLREIVGRKLMLEYDIGSARNREHQFPGIFLRPGEYPINGKANQHDDVRTVAEALMSSVGWTMNSKELQLLESAYHFQPNKSRMDSFGIFPSRARGLRLTIMSFNAIRDLSEYLSNMKWPGQISTVESVIARIRSRVNVVNFGISIDLFDSGLGPDLGLTLMTKDRYTRESGYWVDKAEDWSGFLDALGREPLVDSTKLNELTKWVSSPSMLYSKTGVFLWLKGIHHIKFVVHGASLQKVKAYVFFVISGAF